MRYVISILLLMSAGGCTGHFDEAPLTSVNGLAFISSRIPRSEGLITEKDVAASNVASDLFECSAAKVLEQAAKDSTEP